MTSSTTLTLVDGVRIVVPDSLNLITPYVLQEQQDWFEDEIKFLRGMLQPGQKVIDIGANYGVYTLCMANAVGATGRVWAFEPASGTASLLAEGIAANGYTQVVLEQSALSSVSGTARLSLNDNSELNALVHDAPSTGAVETVPLQTLDECMEKHGWHEIDFMKIDAEGEEVNILKGGERFFREVSPLVQYEIKAGDDLHLELVQEFARRGYDSYRLVPGLDLLVPFDTASPADGYLLNLFCCKPERAARLAAQGLLLDAAAHRRAVGAERMKVLADTFKIREDYDWRRALGHMPYAARFTDLWGQTVAEGDSAEVVEALAFYAFSRDARQASVDRFTALEAGFQSLKRVCERQPSYLRLASLARVARDYGARSLAVSVLQQLGNTIFQQNRVDPREPFLAPGQRFDGVRPGESIGNWVLAAILEESERLGAFSSFYTGTAAQQRLQMIQSLGFGDAEMGRRLRLLQQRFGLSAS